MEHPEAESAVSEEVRADPVSAEKSMEVPAADPSLGSSPIRYGPSGRRLYTLEELPPRIRLRVEYEGKWVAWSPDGQSIIASAELLKDLINAPERAAVPGTYLEWLGD